MELWHMTRIPISACLIASALVAIPRIPAFAQAPSTTNAAAASAGLDGPLSPDKAPSSFRLEPGLRLELVAAEPMVVSPVALAFDERGRLYVAENRGYPTGPGEGNPPVGRIALLEDSDGDGRMDRRTEFAEGLTFPNGVLPWKGGCIVTCAPDVLYLKDTDGDGKADERRVLFTGFATNGSTQLRVSHPTLSIDNWIYLTSGLTGGKVTSPSAPDRAPVVLGRTDFRFRPDGNEWEAADGGAQFGQTFDDFGRRFICYNRVQVQHVVLSSKTLRRNPNLAFSETVQNCPADMVAEPLKGHGAAARLFPISRNVTTADSHAGTFTAACAVFVFRGTGLPPSYRGGAFSCDPTGNLVHFDRLEPSGSTFAARRARDGIEFLASTDNWFRPVFLASGPDGALYVCDMYRKTIEHPDYLPAEIRKHTDFESGKTMGRIWRVVREDVPAAAFKSRRSLNLASATVPELCQVLRQDDGWMCDTAHRLLLERSDKDLDRSLAPIVTDAKAPATAVVHALYLLEASQHLGPFLLQPCLKHPAAPVREHALQLLGRLLAAGSPAIELGTILDLAHDDDARVRFQAAIVLGSWPVADGPSRKTVAGALARIAARDGADRWLRAAVFSGLAGRERDFLTALRDQTRPKDSLPPELISELGRLLGASRPSAEWPELLRECLLTGTGYSPIERAALLTGLAESIRGKVPAGSDVWSTVLGKSDEQRALRDAVTDLATAMNDAALDANRPLEQRRTAVGLLAFTTHSLSGETLLRLLSPGEPSALQIAAVRALSTQSDPGLTTALLSRERFAAYTPALRGEVLSSLLQQSQHLNGVLTAVESGTIPASAIDALHRRQLTQHRDTAIRDRAQKLFGAVAGDRAKVYEAYKDVVAQKADAAHGRVVFRRECASCHRLDREGFPVGPDLFGIRNQPKESILLHVLAPDHEITPGFASYTVATKDGRTLTGLIASETPNSITLRQPLGKEDTILRSEIEELAASKQSLMPQGLEKNITRQEFTDLLAYLKGEDASSP